MEEASLVYRRQEYDTVYNVGTSLAGERFWGIDTHYFSVYGYKVAKGRLFVDRDYDSFRKVAILDTTAIRDSVPRGNPLGKAIEIKGRAFRRRRSCGAVAGVSACH
ncbi:MAG: ABC transporter permease [Clostridia bacterium]